MRAEIIFCCVPVSEFEKSSFIALVSKPFYCAEFSDVEIVVRAVWGGRVEFNGLLDNLGDRELRRAGYLIDKLSRFNCVTGDYLEGLKKVLRMLSSMLGVCNEDLRMARGVESMAVKWGLQEDLKLEIRALLRYQTRHIEP